MRLAVVVGALVVVLAILLAPAARGAVLGIDLGSESIVIATPAALHPEAPNILNTVNIVLNEQSHRKTSNFIGFRGGDRFIGADAQSLHARFPDMMAPMASRLAGLSPSDAAVLLRRNFIHNAVVPGNETRGTAAMSFIGGGPAGEDVAYSAEALLAMLFGFVKRTAENDHPTHEPVTGAVVTVPHFYDARQRQAVIDAAAIAGVRVLSLMHPTTAAAHLCGIRNEGFGGKPHTVMIVDAGAASAHVGIYRYTPPAPSAAPPLATRSSAAFGSLTTLSLVSSAALGGRAIDACVAKMIEDEFVAKAGLPRVLGGSSPSERKAVVALMRAANKVKEMLSANREAPYTVEGVAPDRDYSGKMTRAAFEETCVAEASGAFIEMIATALERAGDLTVAAHVDRFEVIGGALRVPKLLADIQAHFLPAGRALDRTMNGDESAAVGAGFRAAQLASVMRVQSFALQDGFAVPSSLFAFDEKTPVVLAPSAATAGSAPRLPLTRSLRLSPAAVKGADFAVPILASMTSQTSAGGTAPEATVVVSGLGDALARYRFNQPLQTEHNATYTVRLDLTLSEAGLLAVTNAIAQLRYATNTSTNVVVLRNVTEGCDPEANATTPSIETDTAEGEVASEAAVPRVCEREVKERVFRIQMTSATVALSADIRYTRRPLPIGPGEALAASAALQALDERDMAALRVAAAKNNLMTYLVWAKYDGIELLERPATEGSTVAISSAAKEELAARLRAASDWLDDAPEETTSLEDYATRLRDVRRCVLASAAAVTGDVFNATVAARGESSGTAVFVDRLLDGEPKLDYGTDADADADVDAGAESAAAPEQHGSQEATTPEEPAEEDLAAGSD